MINIEAKIKEATLSRDKVALNAYRNIKAEIQKNQTAKGAKPLTSELQLQIISKYAKTLEDAIKQFSEARRDDLVSEYTSELEVVQKLLPAPVNESDIYLFIENSKIFNDKFLIKSETEEGDLIINILKKDMGASIRYLKDEFPTADGKMISEIVKKYIV